MVASPRMTSAEKVIVAVALAVGLAGTLWPAVAIVSGLLGWQAAVLSQWALIGLIVLLERPLTAAGRRALARSRRRQLV